MLRLRRSTNDFPGLLCSRASVYTMLMCKSVGILCNSSNASVHANLSSENLQVEQPRAAGGRLPADWAGAAVTEDRRGQRPLAHTATQGAHTCTYRHKVRTPAHIASQDAHACTHRHTRCARVHTPPHKVRTPMHIATQGATPPKTYMFGATRWQTTGVRIISPHCAHHDESHRRTRDLHNNSHF